MENLKKYMDRTGRNQKQTGEDLGISQVHVSRILAGKDKPSKALKLSIERLLKPHESHQMSERSRKMLEMYESLPEPSKKDIYRIIEKEKRLVELSRQEEEKEAA